MELQSRSAQFESKSSIFWPVWPWNLTDSRNNRASPLCHFKLCATFRSHLLILTEVTVWKGLNWGKIDPLTFGFGFWPWPVAWTSSLSIGISPENFMMIRWEKHSQIVWQRYEEMDRQTDRRMDRTVHRTVWSQRKIISSAPFLPKDCFEVLLFAKHQRLPLHEPYGTNFVLLIFYLST